MSTLTEQLNNGQQANFKRDLSKIFIWNNRFQTEEYTNSSGSSVTLPAGTLMGRVTAGGKVIPLASAAVDGSNIPVGILAADYTVANGVTQKVSICVKGDVAQDKVILAGADTLDTAVSGRPIKDRIAADTQGINLVVSDELTEFDNE